MCTVARYAADSFNPVQHEDRELLAQQGLQLDTKSRVGQALVLLFPLSHQAQQACGRQACGSGRPRFLYCWKYQIFAGSMKPLHTGRALELPQFGERKSIILVGSTRAFDWCRNWGVGDPCSGVRRGLRIPCLQGPFSFNRVRPRRQEDI